MPGQTRISAATLLDARLSYRAKGILAAALSFSPGFEPNRDWINAHGAEGRDAITSAIKELRSLGYVADAWTDDVPPRRALVWNNAGS